MKYALKESNQMHTNSIFVRGIMKNNRICLSHVFQQVIPESRNDYSKDLKRITNWHLQKTNLGLVKIYAAE